MTARCIAVAGNPNAGKSTLFNRLTGARAKVGNYPGVTVERRVATVETAGNSYRVIDLPGCYSLTAHSREEDIAHNVIAGRTDDKPDVILCVVDSTSLARGLYLVLQLVEMGLPVVVALNMIDMADAEGICIDIDKLSASLGVPVIRTDARNGAGIEELWASIGSTHTPPEAPALQLTDADRAAVDKLEQTLQSKDGSRVSARGESIWLLSSETSLAHAAANDERISALVDESRRELRTSSTDTFSRRMIAARYQLIDELLADVLQVPERKKPSTTQRVDDVLLHPVWGGLTFFVTMLILFQTVFAWADPMIGGVEWLVAVAAEAMESVLPEGLLRSLIVHGVIAGIGNVLVFLPQIALLFLGLTILEDSGYMARAALLADRMMRRVGLSGKSFVPLMSSFACAIPGVMAARTIETRRDRMVTLLVAPFMSCSARLPVYVMVVAAVLSQAPPVGGFLSAGGLAITLMYFLGFGAALFTAFLLKRTVLPGKPRPLLLELPPYRVPLWRTVARQVYARSRVFVTQTGTIILALSMILWAALTFPEQGIETRELDAETSRLEEAHAAGSLTDTELEESLTALARRDDSLRLRNSLGGRLGLAIEPIIEPLGFDWRIGIGLVASFAAREVLVSTLGQVYSLDAEIEPDSPALRDALLADVHPETGKPKFSPLVGISLMVFFVLAMQCLSTVATVKRESNSWKWALAQLLYMNTLAYIASLAVFQVGKALGFG